MVAYTNYESDARVIREAEAAVAAGYKVDFLALRKPGEPAAQMIRGVRLLRARQTRYRGAGHVLYMLAYLQFFARCFFRITFTYWSRRYTVIHVNNMPDFLVFCTVIPKLFGTRVVLDIHDPMPNTFASKFKRGERGIFYRLLLLQEKLSAWYADQVITVHEPVKEGILAKHGLKPETIEVIANFPDDNLFRPTEYPPFGGQIRLVYHGTILERSGLRTLAIALSKVRNRERLLIRLIGEGDFSADLKRMIREFDLGGSVDFVNRSFSHYDIPRMVADCHCGLVPLDISSATNFALPLKLVEYVCMGIPVITVRNAAIRYYFGDEDCLYFRAGDADSLRAALERVAARPEVLLAYRERVMRLRDRFSWAQQKDKYVQILRGAPMAPAQPHHHGIHRPEGAVSTLSVDDR
jgi:glycosyltransferase involved in cell wall biosynthesis